MATNPQSSSLPPMGQCFADQEDLLDFLLRYASTMTSVGVQTSRIVKNTTRIAQAYGYEITIMLFQRNLGMTLMPRCHEGHKRVYREAHPITEMMQHRHLPLNFRLNAELSRLSWYAYDHKPSLAELERRFDEVVSAPPTNRWLILLLISCASASFCALFGGDLCAMLFVFVGTFVAFFLRQELNKRHAYHYLVVLLAAFTSSFITASLSRWTGWTETESIAISTSVLFLIPGVPLINALIDMLDGYMLNGLARLVNAMFFVLSITTGIASTLILLGITVLD